MSKITLTAKVVGAQLLWNNAAEVVKVLTQYEGKEISLVLQRLRKTRSYLQNSYYWGVPIEILTKIFRDSGYRVLPDEVHEMLKVKFLRRAVISPEGQVIGYYGGSTAHLSTIEFMEYIADIQQWAVETFGEAGIIPDPNQELIDKNLYEKDTESDQLL